MTSGAQCVTRCGMRVIQPLFAVNWDLPLMVSKEKQLYNVIRKGRHRNCYHKINNKQTIFRWSIGMLSCMINFGLEFVVSRILNIVYTGSMTVGSVQGTGRIWLTNVECTGTERQLSNCTASQISSSCTHAQDVGVRCTPGRR